MDQRLYNQNISGKTRLPSPVEIKTEFPVSDTIADHILRSRQTIKNILDRKDPRLMLVVGPCSIHDPTAAMDYAERLSKLTKEVDDVFFVVMRVYFEKPRTTVGWKGFINDPCLDDSFKIEKGLREARKLLINIANIGLPAGTEALDPVIPQYIHDLISWTAIGARTTESQTHRELASGISTPVGFKNGTDNNLQIAINALESSSQPHHFLGIDHDGQCAIYHTNGNPYGHIVLRGGSQPNYDSVNIALCEDALKEASLAPNIVVDCSHGNSQKKPELQPLVMDNCIKQIVEGNTSIVGLMLESNLHFGQQSLTGSPADLKYGVSITDACIDWQTTVNCITKSAKQLRSVLGRR